MSKAATHAEEICLPKLGESILSAQVVTWLKKEGDSLALDEPICEVATDKVNSEIPSPVAGVLQRILVQEGESVEVGAPLALVVSGEGQGVSVAASEPAYQIKSSVTAHEASKGFLSPAVLRLVREHGIPLSELEHITGSGQDRRITKRDIESYLVARGKRCGQERGESRTGSSCSGAQRLPLSPMRRAIADNMVRSFYQAPHAYLVGEVDVTNLLQAIQAQKESFFQDHGVKLTVTSYLVQAICMMVGEHPLINASMEEEHILVKSDVNVGLAVAVDKGLVVPVVKSCQCRSIPEIAGAIHDLSARARTRALQPEEVTQGSITLTNFGMSGALVGLPIIRHPEVAICGVGAIQKRVVALECGAIAVRQIVHVTLSFDHRAVDGMYAASCLATFKRALEKDLL